VNLATFRGGGAPPLGKHKPDDLVECVTVKRGGGFLRQRATASRAPTTCSSMERNVDVPGGGKEGLVAVLNHTLSRRGWRCRNLGTSQRRGAWGGGAAATTRRPRASSAVNGRSVRDARRGHNHLAGDAIDTDEVLQTGRPADHC